MKGVILTEFVEMVEERFSIQVAEAMFDGLDLPSGGVYTSVGAYDQQELVLLAARLSELTGVAEDELMREFGRNLFRRLAGAFPEFLEGVTCTFDFLDHVEDRIQVEVRKLDPDAELPRLRMKRNGTGGMEMHYESSRPFVDLAEGLILGCGQHFGDELRVSRNSESWQGGQGATFSLTLEKEAATCCL